MNRKQLYNEVTSLGLQSEVQSRYGKNYTTCTNAQLQAVVDEVTKAMKEVSEEFNKVHTCGGKLDKLVEILAKKKILLKSEVAEIMKS